jgi:hypothetical protein
MSRKTIESRVAVLVSTALFASVVGVGCKTTTATSRTDPVVDSVRVSSTRYEPQPVKVEATVVERTKIRFSASRPSKCFQTIVTTHKVVVTEQTRLAEEPRQPDRGSSTYWGDLLKALFIGTTRGAVEGTKQHEEKKETSAEQASEECAKNTPLEGPVVLHLPLGDGETRNLGEMSGGQFTIDVAMLDAGLVEYLETMSQPQLDLGVEKVSVVFSVNDDVVRVAEWVADDANPDGGGEAGDALLQVRIDPSALPALARLVAQRQADADAARLAEEKQRAQVAEAARKKAEAEERVRLASLKREHAATFKKLVVPGLDAYNRSLGEMWAVTDSAGECSSIGACTQRRFTYQWISSTGRFGPTVSEITHAVTFDAHSQTWSFAFRANVEDRTVFFSDVKVDATLGPYAHTALNPIIRRGLLRATQQQTFEEEVAVGSLSCLLKSQGGPGVVYSAQCRPQGW